MMCLQPGASDGTPANHDPTCRISPEGSHSIPHFGMQGRPNIPELLSDKVILTPVAPGNQRGAVWSDNKLQTLNWIADVEFRANGPERGGGNLNIWLVRDGAHSIGAESVYTAGRFEGLALVIDQHSGGGMLRGFLNDGTTDYRTHHNVDNLAFGHCSFSYRNLGRPTQIKLRQTDTKFIVEVAGRPCFDSDKISLPSGYNFGVTAASADNPDSFELFKLAVLTGENNHEYAGMYNNNDNKDHEHQQTEQQPPPQDSNGGKRQRMSFGRSGQATIVDPFDNVIPDQEADKITSSKAQFADLHNRIQSVNHHLSTIFRSIAQNHGVDEQRHAETSAMIGEIKGLLTRLDKLDVMEQRLRDIENEMRSGRHEVAGRLRESEASIKGHHETLAQGVKAHTKSGHTKLILVVVGTQVVLIGAFAYYKRRKTSPKKYL